MNQLRNRIFIENDPRSIGMVGKILGTDHIHGEDVIFYAVYNAVGQEVIRETLATVEQFNRYMQTGKLLWRQ